MASSGAGSLTKRSTNGSIGTRDEGWREKWRPAMKLYLDGFMAWFGLIVAIIALVATPVMLYRNWNRSTKFADAVISGLWYSSDEFRRGHSRAIVPITLAGYPIFVLVVVLFIIPPVRVGE